MRSTRLLPRALHALIASLFVIALLPSVSVAGPRPLPLRQADSATLTVLHGSVTVSTAMPPRHALVPAATLFAVGTRCSPVPRERRW